MNDSIIMQLVAHADDLWRAGNLQEAAQLYEQLTLCEAQKARAHHRLGEFALQHRRLDVAEAHFLAARAADRSLGQADYNLALIYLDTQRPQQARDTLQELTERVPDVPEVWLRLAIALGKLEDFEGAVEAYETALRLRPNYADAFRNLSILFFLMLQGERALECLRLAAECSSLPQDASEHLLLSMFSPHFTPAQVAALAESWDRRFAAALHPPIHASDLGWGSRDPNRPLRIGYVSPAFYHHSNGLLSEPILSRQDRALFLIHCYSDVTTPDEVTARFRRLAVVYRETAHLSDEQLAATIRQDGIDILVDLNAHMKGARLGMFARRAAPVQITYLAYPFTTGLRTLDYRLTDAILDPPVQAAFGPEALIRLRRCFWLFRPNPAAPEPVRRLPARSAGRFTFGNLNYTQKLNPGVAAAWAGILNQLPNARLLLLAGNPRGQRTYVARLFTDAGLHSAHIDLVGPVVHHENLSRYLGVDLCLDPFPYGGHTTTLDALWMGVPVLTLAGPAGYMRGAASMLPHVGLGDLVTHSALDYQKLAVALARDRPRLESYRSDLRERMRRSVLCDEAGWVADYERGLRIAWRRFCQGLPPAEIDLAALPDEE